MTSAGKSPQRAFFLLGLWILVVIFAFAFWYTRSPSALPPQELIGVLRPEPKVLVPFELTDQNEVPFTKERLQGKWSFLFFGYTHCPDVCPATLSVLTKVDSRLEEMNGQGSDMQIIFISVDPERDTPKHLSDYMAYFNKNFTAATGDKTEIDSFTRQYGSGYQKGAQTTDENYLVNHTSAIFLTDPQARLVAAFSQPHNPETIVEQFLKIREYIEY